MSVPLRGVFKIAALLDLDAPCSSAVVFGRLVGGFLCGVGVATSAAPVYGKCVSWFLHRSALDSCKVMRLYPWRKKSLESCSNLQEDLSTHQGSR